MMEPPGGASALTSVQKSVQDITLRDDSASTKVYWTPPRPAHGTQGTKVSLRANFFEIKPFSHQVLYVYSISAAGHREPKGKQLQQVIKIMLDTDPFFCNRKAELATDFSQYLISTRPLGGLPKHFTVLWRKELEDPPQALPLPRVYQVIIEPHTTPSLDVSDVMNRLVRDGVAISQLDFPGQPVIMQTLNIIAGHYTKASHLIVKVGSSKSFSIDPDAPNDAQLPLYAPLGNSLQVRRGFFSSVRVAKGRILLNVNPTASAFYKPITPAGEPMYLDELIKFRHELDIGDLRVEENRLKLEAAIKGMRVRRRDLPPRKNAAGQEIPDARIIFGLADPRDGVNERRSTFTTVGPLATVANCWNEETGKQRTVAQTYPDFYKGITVQQPVVNIGNREFPDYVLTSMCKILPGNLSKVKLTDKVQQKAMIDFAVLNPPTARYAIERKCLSTLGLLSTATPQSIPLSIDAKMIEIVGRRLQMPDVKYQKLVTSKPREGKRENRSGSWNMEGLKFSKPMSLTKWAVIRFKFKNSYKTDDQLRMAVQNFRNEMALNGLVSQPPEGPHIHTIQDMDDGVIGTALKNLFEQHVPNALIVLPNAEAPLYNRIKTAGDIMGGIQTTCVTEDKFMGRGCDDRQYFSNVSLKINLKLGGVNHIANDIDLPVISQGKTMVVGYDVTHPAPSKDSRSNDVAKSDGKSKPPGGKKSGVRSKMSQGSVSTEAGDQSKGDSSGAPKETSKPTSKKKLEPNFNPKGLKVNGDPDSPRRSIAGMVASINKDLAQWPAILRMQELAGQEMVIKLQEMLETRLDLWAKHNGNRLPDNILIFRDGVSESQYKTVLVEEMPLLQAACAAKCKLNQQKPPGITLVIVGKRHHSRFMKIDGKDHVENPQFGTVVDSGVTHDAIWDFYLQSHQPWKGTARPAHYIVLRDEIFTPRYLPSQAKNAVHDLERLCNTMCQLNGRATKPVSIVPAASYADLACTRAARYVDRYYQAPLSADTQREPVQPSHIAVQASRIADTMFYI